MKLAKRNDLMPPIAAIRGPGAMIGFEYRQAPRQLRAGRGAAHQPPADHRRRSKHGLVVLSCGTNANVIRILVPLTASPTRSWRKASTSSRRPSARRWRRQVKAA